MTDTQLEQAFILYNRKAAITEQLIILNAELDYLKRNQVDKTAHIKTDDADDYFKVSRPSFIAFIEKEIQDTQELLENLKVEQDKYQYA